MDKGEPGFSFAGQLATKLSGSKGFKMIDPALVRTEKLKTARERQEHARELGGDLLVFISHTPYQVDVIEVKSGVLIARSEPANYSNPREWASFVTSAVAEYRP
jgi:hypothetical protein